MSAIDGVDWVEGKCPLHNMSAIDGVDCSRKCPLYNMSAIDGVDCSSSVHYITCQQ